MSVAPADLLQEEGKSVANDLPRRVNTTGSYREVCLTPQGSPVILVNFPSVAKKKLKSLE